MKSYSVLLVPVSLLVAPVHAQAQNRPAARAMPSFASDSEFVAFLPRPVRSVPPPSQPAPTVLASCTADTTRRQRTGITGVVRDQSGSAIAGAQVLIVGSSYAGVANEQGCYRIDNVPAGVMTVRGQYIGYTPTESRGVRVYAGQVTTVNLTLSQQAVTLEGITITEDGVSGLAPGVVSVSGSTGAPVFREGVTNTQHVGVDEGGIVKVHGNYLVVLRRGRLFTVAIRGGALRPVDATDAFGPGMDPGGAWYDEMLIHGNKIVVIGYSYRRGGTEVGIFRIDDAGRLDYESSFQLRSNDYYSSRNYASRLIGSRLVFYSPQYLGRNTHAPLTYLPAVRKWRGQNGTDGFERIAPATQVFYPAQWRPGSDVTLHSVTSCDLAEAIVRCDARTVIGPAGRVFYVSPSAVYVWMTSWEFRKELSMTSAVLVRMPFDRAEAPVSIGVSGSPVDQFSFLESDDRHLNVFVVGINRGEAMWAAERGGVTGTAALLRLPLDSMSDGSRNTSPAWYRPLTAPTGGALHNRFVGSYLLFGDGQGWGGGRTSGGELTLVPWRGGDQARMTLPHGVDRIEIMGSDAVVVGARGSDLTFSGIRLVRTPRVVQQYTLANAAQGETRSHGFFYRNDGADSGVLGLPIRRGGAEGWRQLIEGSASIVYLRNAGVRFDDLGRLKSGPTTPADGCRASCVDWYGNARPLFLDGRVFALLGYELVEGRIDGNVIRELQRISYAPRTSLSIAGDKF